MKSMGEGGRGRGAREVGDKNTIMVRQEMPRTLALLRFIYLFIYLFDVIFFFFFFWPGLGQHCSNVHDCSAGGHVRCARAVCTCIISLGLLA